MRKGTTYEVMLRFFIKADSKSGAWKVLQRISENVRERFPEVVRSEPFDVSEHENREPKK
jgi:hypothetical protein